MATALDLLLSRLSHPDLRSLSAPLLETLDLTPYTPSPTSVPVKSLLHSFLVPRSPSDLRRSFLDLCLCFAAISSTGCDLTPPPIMSWISPELRGASEGALTGLAGLLGVVVRELVESVMVEVVPILKALIRESCVDAEEEIVAVKAKPPVEHAVIAGLQFRWFVSQVHYPHLGQLCSLVIPCALTALDHWSPEVKDQGMLSFIQIAKNVTSAELGWFEDPILDACCNNIASSDELWHRVAEMTVLMLTSILRGNPRSPWYEKIFSEMLSHLERQPMSKDRRISWLMLIEPVLNAMGLILLAHFKRIFSLFFQWLHVDDDKTLLLVLERTKTIIKLTWVRKSPHFDRLVDQLILLYKEASMKQSRQPIRSGITSIFILLKKCKGTQFEASWDKHKMDPNLTQLALSICDS